MGLPPAPAPVAGSSAKVRILLDDEQKGRRIVVENGSIPLAVGRLRFEFGSGIALFVVDDGAHGELAYRKTGQLRLARRKDDLDPRWCECRLAAVREIWFIVERHQGWNLLFEGVDHLDVEGALHGRRAGSDEKANADDQYQAWSSIHG